MSKEGELSVWHLTMLALGTVVGGSFFLGSAIAIRTAGPGIIISYLLVGVLVYIILTALSEMTVAEQLPGSFRTYAEQMFGPLVGFVVGWVYWTGLILAMSSEATAASLLIKSWLPTSSLSLTSILIIIGVTFLNLLGAKILTTLESGLALIKLSAIVAFILIGIALILGLVPNKTAIGLGALTTEPLLPTGISGIAGSMLIVMFTYAGFEMIGLAASEAEDARSTIPRAINYTVLGLVGLYSLAIVVLLPLIPTAGLTEEVGPFVAALNRVGINWVANIINIILIIAILSTMLAAMFGLGRMVRSLAKEGSAPSWLKDKGDIPFRGIIFSGISMLAGVGLAYILPSEIYVFLVSSGGFSLLFVYVIIMATHYKFRKNKGCPPSGNCQLRGYPTTSLFALFFLIAIIVSMPLVPGQGSGLIAGLLLVAFYSLSYIFIKVYSLIKSNEEISLIKLLGIEKLNKKENTRQRNMSIKSLKPATNWEVSEELVINKSDTKKSKQ
ncbi:AAT family amino acid transporter [Orenia metallireducens]|uniref:Amino acid transporter, AAT family n=1 Tax=Orenia metallireducens TaxID=1413210 RepID=A0A285GKE4_9FIRM|nr:amino acid permease [Orenia metallireducens]PRX35794.1 AAT family amino acid transporter [Orenia metallireducens]SNY23908.1 amino acid transporter, AAT family [Orenia metallireducens]